MSVHTPWAVIKARRALAELGRVNHAHEVAERLWRANAYGVPRSACRCPVAVYLRRRSGAVDVAVSRLGVRACDDACVVDAFDDRRWYDVDELPVIVTRFITEFDDGRFPELNAHRREEVR